MNMTSIVALSACLVVVMGCQPRVRGSRRRVEYWWATLGLASGVVTTLPTLLNPNISPSSSLALQVAPICVVSVLLVLSNVRRGAALSAIGAGLLLFLTVPFAFALPSGDLTILLLSLSVLLPAIIVPASGYDKSSLFLAVSDAARLAAMVLAVLLILKGPQLIGSCRGDKCSIWGSALGPEGTGNALGVCLAVMIGLALLNVRDLKRWMLVAAAGFVLVDLTSSRSGFAILVAGLGFSLVRGAYWRESSSMRGHRAADRMVFVAAGLLTVAVAALPFLRWSAGSFTGRATLWQIATDELVPRSPIFGHGASYWVRQAATAQLQANYSTHNMAVEILVTAGAWGIACMAVILFSATQSRATPGVQSLCVAMIGIWLASGLTEVTSLPGRTYLYPAFLTFILMVCQSSPVRGISGDLGARGRAGRSEVEG
ncbi:O-antigen ligase [Curtobacterium sp. PhB115]|uniref:O-antigen ligase family protein n=1 Tax=Curtobacterium sp. PhB115 TaxID=2485173 RepID=UPI000FAD6979|nr:hypothetical protein EDF19_0837 [Curtobacterium sp. PhB115]